VRRDGRWLDGELQAPGTVAVPPRITHQLGRSRDRYRQPRARPRPPAWDMLHPGQQSGEDASD